jgi:hypothetical protein
MRWRASRPQTLVGHLNQHTAQSVREMSLTWPAPAPPVGTFALSTAAADLSSLDVERGCTTWHTTHHENPSVSTSRGSSEGHTRERHEGCGFQRERSSQN